MPLEILRRYVFFQSERNHSLLEYLFSVSSRQTLGERVCMNKHEHSDNCTLLHNFSF